VAEFLEIVEELEASAKDPGIRKKLEDARDSFEDVGEVFLADLDNASRTPAQETRWLGYATMALTLGQLHLQAVQDAVQKYGPNVQTID
jgi:hypothetical protein